MELESVIECSNCGRKRMYRKQTRDYDVGECVACDYRYFKKHTR